MTDGPSDQDDLLATNIILTSADYNELRDSIAAALVVERERARTPFLALIARLEATDGPDEATRNMARFMAAHIRWAAEDNI